MIIESMGTLALLLLVLSAAGLAVGWLAGRRARRRTTGDSSTFTTVLAGSVGLLGLLLAFSFAMAESRYDARRLLVIDEANAIGTAYLRTEPLPEPQRSRLRALFREYVDLRLQRDSPLDERIARAEEIQREMWAIAAQLMRQDPQVVPTGLFVQSLNEVIDLQTKRLRAFHDIVPRSVLVLLTAALMLVQILLGYGFGLAGRLDLLPVIVVTLLLLSVTLVVVDFDRPTQGLIRASQQPLIDLRASMDRNTATMPH